MKNTMKSIFAAVVALLASAAPGGEDSPLLKRGADGFGDVRSAAFFARDGKMDEGRAFIAELFRMIAAFRNESEPPTGTAKVPEKDFGAPLVSGDALVRISSSGKGDTPEDYARVTDATPYDPKRKGLFATKPEDAPYAVVELAGNVEIAGVTVVGEAKNLVLWISDNGEEWRKVGERGMGNGERRVDLRKDSPSAKFVKVGFEPGGSKRSLSLKKILVYGNKLY